MLLPPTKAADLATTAQTVWFQVRVAADATCAYSYSCDGRHHQPLGSRYPVASGTWIGAKTEFFCLAPNAQPSRGYAVFDFFEVTD